MRGKTDQGEGMRKDYEKGGEEGPWGGGRRDYEEEGGNMRKEEEGL